MTRLKISMVTSNSSIVAGMDCPGCGEKIYLDDDQFHGRRAITCGNPDCIYRDVIDYRYLEVEGEMTSNASHLRR